MNIKFSWKRDGNNETPVCRSDVFNQDGISLLDCILMDDGGLPHRDSIPWLQEGLNRLNLVASGESDSSDWDRETWGVKCLGNKVAIYSLHNEEYYQSMGLEVFSTVLKEWIAFIHSGPGAQESKILSLSPKR